MGRTAFVISSVAALAAIVWLAMRAEPGAGVAQRPATDANRAGEAPVEPAAAPSEGDDRRADPGNARSEIDGATASAPALRGRLVYASTEQGLPWFRFELKGRDGSEFVTTTSDGTWTSFSVREPPLSVVLWDYAEPGSWTDPRVNDRTYSLEPAAGGTVPELAVDACATFLLSGAGEGELIARSDVGNFVHADLDAPVRDAPDGRRYWRSRMHPRAWRGLAGGVGTNGPPWRLLVRRADAASRATAEVASLEGVTDAALAWESLGVVELDVRTAYEPQPSWNVEAWLQPAGTHEGDFRALDTRELDLAAPGRSALRWEGVVPGDYLARVRTAFCEPVSMPIRVAGGTTVRESAELKCPEPRGTIVVEVTNESRSAAIPHAGSWRRSPAQEFVQPATFTRYEHEPIPRAVYEFRDRPDGEYDVWVETDQPVAPARRAKARPGDRLSFVVLDLAPEVGVGFRAYDARSGAPIESFEIQIFGVHTFRGSRKVRSGEIVIDKWPDRGSLEWRASLAGYHCHVASFDATTTSELSDGVRWIDLRFEPGWSANAIVEDPDGHRVEGATVFADGVEIGLSGVEGVLPLRLPTRPASLVARHPDFLDGAAKPEHLASVTPCFGVAIRLTRP